MIGTVLTLSEDARTQVALSNIPSNLAASFQALMHIVTPIYWLFAGPQRSLLENSPEPYRGVANGFTLTGRVTDTSEVENQFNNSNLNVCFF